MFIYLLVKLRALRRLQHENLVNMLEFTRKRRRLYIIFEFVDGNVLDYLESSPNRQISPIIAQEIIWQLLRALEFMHQVCFNLLLFILYSLTTTQKASHDSPRCQAGECALLAPARRRQAVRFWLCPALCCDQWRAVHGLDYLINLFDKERERAKKK